MFEQTMIKPNMTDALHESGSEFHIRVEPDRVRLNEEELRNSPNFQDIWLLDVPPEKLSARLRDANCGWINQLE
jgi:hypothetical protein